MFAGNVRNGSSQNRERCVCVCAHIKAGATSRAQAANKPLHIQQSPLVPPEIPAATSSAARGMSLAKVSRNPQTSGVPVLTRIPSLAAQIFQPLLPTQKPSAFVGCPASAAASRVRTWAANATRRRRAFASARKPPGNPAENRKAEAQ